MTRDLQSFSPSILLSPSALARKRQRKLLNGFWLIAFGLLVFEIFFSSTNSLLTNFGAILITTAALLPTYLWCSGRALGIPIFPLFALTYIWTYALPLITNHPVVIKYSSQSHLFASLTVTGFLGLGTFIWLQFVKSTPATPPSYLVLTSARGVPFFLFVLAIYVLFSMSNLGGWLILDTGTFSLIRGLVLGLSALAIFVLSYRLGTKELSTQKSQLFLCILLASIVTDSMGLLLVSAASQFLIATVAFILGRRKLPIIPIVIALICLSCLHYGKGEMRAKYWVRGDMAYVQPWEYPARYAEWAGYSWQYLTQGKNNDLSASANSEEKASFVERSSIIQLLLLTQSESPEQRPYLYGATYAILPQLIVPRFLNNNKIASHEGTYILNIHYGLQTRKDTFTTTIGWGLLAEAYANFGLLGCGGLATILGLLYGQVTRWSINAPVLSAKYLFAIVIINLAFQTEFSAGVYVAALFQSSAGLGCIAVLLMKSSRVPRFSF